MASPFSRNLLLRALPPEELERAASGFEEIALPLKLTLYDRDQRIEHVYFPLSGVASVVNEPTPGQVVEFGTVGHEGMVGVPLLLATDSMPSRVFIQVPGSAVRMPGALMMDLMARHPAFHRMLMRFTQALFNQVAQSTSCNRLHAVQERAARWLLQTQDRVQSDSFPLTQEFLAQMLGVHRPTVTIAARMLQQAGLITYTRGNIRIMDRPGLEQASCECYGIIRATYERLLS